MLSLRVHRKAPPGKHPGAVVGYNAGTEPFGHPGNVLLLSGMTGVSAGEDWERPI